MRIASGSQKTFYFLTFLGWIFFHEFLTKFLTPKGLGLPYVVGFSDFGQAINFWIF
jgi:hypothetical protein